MCLCGTRTGVHDSPKQEDIQHGRGVLHVGMQPKQTEMARRDGAEEQQEDEGWGEKEKGGGGG